MKERQKLAPGAAIFLAALAADRFTKVWCAQVLTHMEGGRMTVLPGVVDFHYVVNSGAAFGMLSGFRWLNAILTAALLTALALIVWRWRDRRGVLPFGALLFAGGLSHLYDRIVSGSIVDFIELTFVRFAIFNVADVCICAGVAGLACACLWSERRRRE